MHRAITRAFLAVATAGAAFTALAFTGAGLAGASTHAAIPAIYNQGSAGYVTGVAWRIRYAETSVTIPAAQSTAGNNATAAIALVADTGGYLATITVTPGGGAGSLGYLDRQFAHGTFHLSPSVGDVVKISIYRDRAGNSDYFTATNLRTGRVQTVGVITSAAVVYNHAALQAAIDNTKVVTPPADVRLWVFKNSRLTSYDGTRGTLFGPWTLQQLVDTTNGTATGAVVMSPSYPSNAGQNFGVWLRHH